MLRRANEHEAAAFLLVERMVRRMRPVLGARGLEAIILPQGRIERASLGRLRFRFNGDGSDFEPENRLETRRLSDQEASWWADMRKVADVARPVADPHGNLVSMRIGGRVLRRLPQGNVVTFLPDGTAPFVGSFRLPRLPIEGGKPKPEATFPLEAAREWNILAAIDAFLREDDGLHPAARAAMTWDPSKTARRPRFPGAMAPMTRNRMFTRSKWHKCPICRAPVVKGRFNPRIPFGAAEAGIGAIRDLRGGYLSRLRETYIVEDPESLLELAVAKDEVATRQPPEALEHA